MFPDFFVSVIEPPSYLRLRKSSVSSNLLCIILSTFEDIVVEIRSHWERIFQRSVVARS